MNNSVSIIKSPENETVLSYRKGSAEREELITVLEKMEKDQIEIPLIIGGKEIKTGNTGKVVCPHNHQKQLAVYHKAGEKEVQLAIQKAMEAKKDWENTTWEYRASVMFKIAESISKTNRALINAATMLGQSKTVFQAEIDSACEVIDFLRYNAQFASDIYLMQPKSTNDQINRLEYRPLEGFVFAVSPFNFTSIASNLNMAPVMMGNTTVWKPASTSLLSNYYLMKIFQEAGLPDGVVNFVPGQGSVIGKGVINHKDFGGIHFTGSNGTFNNLWRQVSQNLESYISYPKLVGETGGKNFVFVHESADVFEVATAIIRGGFEYQGQKCSAVSRSYIPHSLWNEIKKQLQDMVAQISMGDVTDFKNFMNAVIDEASFDNIMGYINKAKQSKDCTIISGGNGDKSKGYFIEPTIIQTTDPKFITMQEEIFGPVVTIYVYDGKKYAEALNLCNETSPYALTGAVFSHDLYATAKASEILKYAAGNFYINDKPTGAVVGMQPFGGSRASGTNDKAGGLTNLLRWANPRNIKENLIPPKNFKYPFME